MIIRLFCPKCAHEVSKSLVDYAEIDVPVPVSGISDSGEYEIMCSRGHTSFVVLNNLKFELLFEMGLNALVNGYPREAVSSFTAALERFYEFYWRVTIAHFSITDEAAIAAWKPLSRQSERQLCAYISASLMLTKKPPRLLNPNKEVVFRNNVIHNGYVPTLEEATEFGDIVMALINEELDTLRALAPDMLIDTYKRLLPKRREEDKENSDEITGAINILTAIDVTNPPKAGDVRSGKVTSQFPRIVKEREPKRMTLLSKKEMKRRYPDRMPEETSDQ